MRGLVLLLELSLQGFVLSWICLDHLHRVLIMGQPQMVEYENLRTICFSCGRFAHSTKHYPHGSSVTGATSQDRHASHIPQFGFGPWLVPLAARYQYDTSPPQSTSPPTPQQLHATISSALPKTTLKSTASSTSKSAESINHPPPPIYADILGKSSIIEDTRATILAASPPMPRS